MSSSTDDRSNDGAVGRKQSDPADIAPDQTFGGGHVPQLQESELQDHIDDHVARATGASARAPSIRPSAGFFSPKKAAQQRAAWQGRKDFTSLQENADTAASSEQKRLSGFLGLSTMGRAAANSPYESRLPSSLGSAEGEQVPPGSASQSRDHHSLGEKRSIDPLMTRDAQPLTISDNQLTWRRNEKVSRPDDTEHGQTPDRARLSAVQSSRSAKTNGQAASSPFAMCRSDKERRRRYHEHQGFNKFFLGGLVMTSRDNILAFLGSLTLALVLPILWFIFDAPYVWRHISPAPVILFAYAFLVALTSMLVTSLRDPGVLPRNLDPDPPCTAGEGTGFIPLSDPLAIPVPRIIRVRHGTDLKVKWCDTCALYRPPRSSHCRVCDNCVENIDHHCTFLNTCIGRRNYVTFIAFLVSAIIASLLAVTFSALHLYYLTRTDKTGNDSTPLPFKEALSKSPLSAVLFFLFLGATGPLVILLAYHVRLIGMNRTTVEQIRINATKLYSEKPDYNECIDAEPNVADQAKAGTHGCLNSAILCSCCGCNALGQAGRDPNPFGYRTIWRNVCAVMCRPITVESWLRPYDFTVNNLRRENPGF